MRSAAASTGKLTRACHSALIGAKRYACFRLHYFLWQRPAHLDQVHLPRTFLIPRSSCFGGIRHAPAERASFAVVLQRAFQPLRMNEQRQLDLFVFRFDTEAGELFAVTAMRADDLALVVEHGKWRFGLGAIRASCASTS